MRFCSQNRDSVTPERTLHMLKLQKIILIAYKEFVNKMEIKWKEGNAIHDKLTAQKSRSTIKVLILLLKNEEKVVWIRETKDFSSEKIQNNISFKAQTVLHWWGRN